MAQQQLMFQEEQLRIHIYGLQAELVRQKPDCQPETIQLRLPISMAAHYQLQLLLMNQQSFQHQFPEPMPAALAFLMAMLP